MSDAVHGPLDAPGTAGGAEAAAQREGPARAPGAAHGKEWAAPQLGPPPLLGPRALALAPRGAPRGLGPAAWGGPLARIAYRRGRLAPELAGLLGQAEAVRIEAGASAPEQVCELPLELLGELARSHPDAALLLAAWDQVRAPAPRPRLMGIVNVTPDSFSDGGRYDDPERAVERGLELEAAGAEILDVGGESTRPGSLPVPARVELERVLPVVEGLARVARVPISVDTTKAEVARRALGLGARWINDTSAGRDDPSLLGVAAAAGATVVLMHRRGTPRDMQRDPTYDDPVREVADFLRERAVAGLQAGIRAPKILLDPGIGFGKRLEHNLELLRRLAELRSLGLPLLLGVSRKAFIHQAACRDDLGPPGPASTDRPAARIAGTAAALTACVLGGASVLRVHDVAQMVQAVRVAQAVAQPSPSPGPP